MVTMKGLPLAYSKDMQDDKPPVFEVAGLLELCIAAMTGMIADSDLQHRPDAAGGGAGLRHGNRPCRLAGALKPIFRSAKRITSPARR